MLRRVLLLLVVAAAAIVAGACGDSDRDAASEGVRTAPDAGEVRSPTPDDPLRVLVVGDSVTGEMRLPIEAALEGGGAATVEFVVQPTLPREAGYQQLWEQALAEARPELVVVMVGHWERSDLEAWRPELLPDAAAYRRDEVEPFVRSATSAGARVLWVGAPAVSDPGATEVYEELNRRFAEVAADEDGVDYLDGSAAVAGPDGGYVEVGEGPDGPERLRWPDGLHLCPDGSVRMAEPVLEWIVAEWGVPLGEGWRDGPWRETIFSGAEACPPL